MKTIYECLPKVILLVFIIVIAALPRLAFAQINVALTTIVYGEGEIILDPPGGVYESGTSVNMTAQADEGWIFTGWSGDVLGDTSPYTIIMSDNQTVTATFIEIPATDYTLSVIQIGLGTVIKHPNKTVYAAGEWVQLKANPANGWAFMGWTGDFSGIDNPFDINMSDNKTVTATFVEIVKKYTLTTNSIGSGSVSRNPDKPEYTTGETVQLTANPIAGWTFTDWGGDLTGNISPQSITMDGDKTITAAFIQNNYTITSDNIGHGTVLRNPDKPSYHYGDTVQFTAVPAMGWAFTGWSGNFTGSQNPLSVSIDGDVSVTAAFSQNAYVVTISTVGNGSIIRNPDQASYNFGTQVELTAEPDDGWSFVGWSGNITGTTNPQSITVGSEISIIATFIQDQYTLTLITNGSGSVTQMPKQDTYTYGTIVQLTAVSSTDWIFDNWVGDLSGQDNPKSIVMNKNSFVQANFRSTVNTSSSGNLGNTSGSYGGSGISYGPGVTQISPYTNNNGVFMIDATVKSDDGLVMLNISEGVTAQTGDKKVLKTIKIIPIESPAVALPNGKLIGKVYEITPEGASFVPSITLAIFYSLDDLTEDIDRQRLNIVFFNSDTLQWEIVPSLVNQADSYVTGNINHFSIFTISGNNKEAQLVSPTQPEISQKNFHISDLSVNPGSVLPGQKITITSKINNLGETTGNCHVTLKINGTVEMIRDTEIPAGSSIEITFNTSRKDPGNYQVDVNDATASFIIMDKTPNATNLPLSTNTTSIPTISGQRNINWLMLVVVVSVFCCVIILFIVLNRHR